MSVILRSLNISLFFLYFLVTGFSKGYAFVEYRSERDANLAWRVSETLVNNYSPIKLKNTKMNYYIS